MTFIRSYQSLSRYCSFQHERYPKALEPDYAVIDERSVKDLLAYMFDLSAGFSFIADDFSKQGNWSSLFAASEISLIAKLAHFCDSYNSLQNIHTGMQSRETKIESIIHCALELDERLQLIRGIDSQSARNMSVLICNSIEQRLTPALLALMHESVNLPVSLSALHKLSTIWRPVIDNIAVIEQERAKKRDLSKKSPPPIELYSPEQEARIDHTVFAFIGELSAISHACSEGFESLLQKQIHDPTIAMILAFLQLYKKVQNDINLYASKHLHFYYFDVLKIQKQQRATHAVFVQASLKPQVSDLMLDANNHFTGSNNIGQDIPYCAAGIFALSRAKIAHIQQINVARDPLISPEQIFGHTQQITKINRHVTPLDGSGTEWPLFGEKHGFIDDIPKTDESLGFAIACDDFALAEGGRTIGLSLSLRHSGVSANIINILARWNSRFDRSHTNTRLYKACLIECFTEYDHVFSMHFATPVAAFIDRVDGSDIAHFFEQTTNIQAYHCLAFYLLHRLQNLQPASVVKKSVGLLFTQQIMSDHKWLNEQHLNVLTQGLDVQAKGQAITDQDAQTVTDIIKGKHQYRSRYFIANMFTLALSSELGWLDVQNHSLSLDFDNDTNKDADASEESALSTFTLKLDIKLDVSAPAIIGFDANLHEGAFDTQKPVLRVTLNPLANYYAYNLLDGFRLNSVLINVKAEEVSSVLQFNQLGRLDSGSASMIFGPRPALNSSFYIGNFEAARKNVTHYQLSVEYGQLPAASKGFEHHYRDYPQDIQSNSFQVSLSYLNDGNYIELKHVPMFVVEDGRLQAKAQYTFDKPEGFPVVKSHHSAASFNDYASLKNGLLKLSLIKPSLAFGHHIYPSLTIERMTRNAKVKFAPPLSLPEEPYTPLINKLSLSYEACSVYSFLPKNHTQLTANADTGAELFHHSSFGTFKAIASSANKSPDLLPIITEDATILLGFEAPTKLEYVSIFFDMKDNCELDLSVDAPPIKYRCYCSNGWTLIPQADVLMDLTQGLTQTGVVTVKLPSDWRSKVDLHKQPCYWLSVSTSQQHQAFPSIRAISTNVILLEAFNESEDEQHVNTLQTMLDESHVADLNWRAQDSRLGPLAFLSEQGSVLNEQTDRDLIQATSERLRHKNRPVTALDFEQFVLAHFPSIYTAKCFSNIHASAYPQQNDDIQFSPGHLMIVVLPQPKSSQDVTDAIGASSTMLAKVYAAVSDVAPMGAGISVVNPIYERIQVRCAVKFTSQAQSGLMAKQLNQDISAFFDPFSRPKTQYLFGWQLTCEALAAHIRQQNYVAYLTNFSILHISKNERNEYFLQDSVSLQHQDIQTIQSKVPWCLPLPDKQHVIDIIADTSFEIPNETGIDEMEVGNNFIVGA